MGKKRFAARASFGSFTVFFTDFEKKKRLFCSLPLERNAGKDYLNMFTTPKYTVYDRITLFCKQPTQLYMSVQTRGNIRVNCTYLDVINNADLKKRNFLIMCLHFRGEPGRPNCKH